MRTRDFVATVCKQYGIVLDPYEYTQQTGFEVPDEIHGGTEESIHFVEWIREQTKDEEIKLCKMRRRLNTNS